MEALKQERFYTVEDIYDLPAGVREYWVVDPDRSLVVVYDFEKDTMEEYGFADKVRVGIYEGSEIDLSKITRDI